MTTEGHGGGLAGVTLTARRHVKASRARVWDVIADGWTYSQWVVGNSRMRSVDREWPAEGATIHHSIGLWPFLINDRTVSQSCRPQEELVLLARLSPLGAARIVLRLNDDAGGCFIEMAELPVEGLLSLIPDSIALGLAYPRNQECLSRLAALAERRDANQ